MNAVDLLEQTILIARRAGEVIVDIYATDFSVRTKEDASPVTDADDQAETLIVRELARLTPEVPTVSEEAFSADSFPAVGGCFWLVDPLDGTKEFVSRNGEFTVNLALIEDGTAVLGVVLAPALGRLFAGALGRGAFTEEHGTRRPIVCRAQPAEGLTVVFSRSHGDAKMPPTILNGRRVASSVTAGSSLKFCMIACGNADLYPRFGRTMEWDTAAGDAVLRAAGGTTTTVDGAPLTYGKRNQAHDADFANPHFIARGRVEGC
jgi:3'(2'), 5'-bisphosphate nucleotidase